MFIFSNSYLFYKTKIITNEEEKQPRKYSAEEKACNPNRVFNTLLEVIFKTL